MNRTTSVVRMQLINRMTFLWIPLIILAASLLITLAIWGIIVFSIDASGGGGAEMFSGGSQAPLWYFVVIGVQALTLTFPFSQAMSVTRREFFLGTMLTAAGSALLLTAIYLIGGLIETVTGGWGMDGYFFRLPWVWSQGPVIAALFFLVACMLAFTAGFWASTIYKRFGLTILVGVGIGFAALLVLAAFLISHFGAWPTIGRWIVEMQPWHFVAGSTVVWLALAAGSFLTLRRATP